MLPFPATKAHEETGAYLTWAHSNRDATVFGLTLDAGSALSPCLCLSRSLSLRTYTFVYMHIHIHLYIHISVRMGICADIYIYIYP